MMPSTFRRGPYEFRAMNQSVSGLTAYDAAVRFLRSDTHHLPCILARENDDSVRIVASTRKVSRDPTVPLQKVVSQLEADLYQAYQAAMHTCAQR